MSGYNFPVPGSKDEKDIIFNVHRHWASFLGQFLLSFILVVIPIIILILVYVSNRNFFQGLTSNFIVLAFSVYYLIAITFAFVAWVSFYYNVYIVTKDEIIEITQVGFFGRKISQLSLLRVQDVTCSVKGFLPTIFSYGDALVETAGEQSENFLLKDVPNPQEMCAQIMKIHSGLVGRESREDQMLEGEGVLRDEGEKEIIEEHLETPSPNNTPYQELLAKEKTEEGEVSKDDLDKGGEIEIK